MFLWLSGTGDPGKKSSIHYLKQQEIKCPRAADDTFLATECKSPSVSGVQENDTSGVQENDTKMARVAKNSLQAIKLINLLQLHF